MWLTSLYTTRNKELMIIAKWKTKIYIVQTEQKVISN